MKRLIFNLLHKVYRVNFQVGGKRKQFVYLALLRWEEFDLGEAENLIASELQVMPQKIKITSITRM